MSLFNKFKNKNKMENQMNKRNEINNKELKESVANAALSALKQDEDYNSLSSMAVEFGYLFDIDKHGIEALFKITTDKGTFYFAAQKASVTRLDFNEELFKNVTRKFLEMHS